MEETLSTPLNITKETENIDRCTHNIYEFIYNKYPKEDRTGKPISSKESQIKIVYKFGSYYLELYTDNKGKIRRKNNKSSDLTEYHLDFIGFIPSEDMTTNYYWSLYTKDKVTGDYTEYTNAGGVLEKQIYTKSEWEDLEGNPFVNTGVSSENWPSRQKSQIKEEDILFLKEFFNTLKEAITI